MKLNYQENLNSGQYTMIYTLKFPYINIYYSGSVKIEYNNSDDGEIVWDKESGVFTVNEKSQNIQFRMRQAKPKGTFINAVIGGQLWNNCDLLNQNNEMIYELRQTGKGNNVSDKDGNLVCTFGTQFSFPNMYYTMLDKSGEEIGKIRSQGGIIGVNRQVIIEFDENKLDKILSIALGMNYGLLVLNTK